jgi:glycerophosphoryl diester phosphodiesterase
MKRILILLAISAMTFTASIAQNPVIAHRGAWKAKALPENSIASLKEAIHLGCYGTEFDVHMTNDGVLVVNHDAEFMGLPIEKSSYQELLAKKMSNGESIPRLEEYLQEGLKQHQTKLILEIKPSQAGLEMDVLLTTKAVKMVQEMRGEDAVDYISFSYDILKKVLELQPKARVAYLKGDVPLEQMKKDGFYGADYHYSVYKKGDWFAEAKRLGLTINAWTVNDRENMQWLLDQHADFITTNEPEMLLELIRR